MGTLKEFILWLPFMLLLTVLSGVTIYAVLHNLLGAIPLGLVWAWLIWFILNR